MPFQHSFQRPAGTMMDAERFEKLVAGHVFGDSPVVVLNSKTFRNPYSLVYRFEYAIDRSPQTLFLKLPTGTAVQADRMARLRREFELTGRVKSTFPETPGLSTVSPAGFIDDVGGFVTWGIRGKSLQKLINTRLRFRFRGEDQHLAHLSGLAGCWLQRFHNLDILEDQVDFGRRLTGFFDSRLDALTRIGYSRVSEDLAESTKTRISAWMEEILASPQVRVVLCHNDYSPHNIMVTEDGICVLDFSFAGPGLPAFDVACFWHKLEDLKNSPLYGNKMVDGLQCRFLNAYGSNVDLMRPDFKLGLARLVLSKMLTMLNSRSLRWDSWIERRRRYGSYLALLESGFELAR